MEGHSSKATKFCETSSIFELDHIKNVLPDFLRKWKVKCRADGLVRLRFSIFPLHLSKVLRLPRKVKPGHTKCWTCHAKSFEQTWRSDAPKCHLRPNLLKSLMKMSLVPRLPCDMHLCRSSSNVPRLPSFFKMLQNLHVWIAFDKVQNPWRVSHKATVERAKVCVSYILTSKGASRHNGACFFHISTSRNVRTSCFLHVLTFKCASRHNSMQFLSSPLPRWLRARRFGEPTLRPSGATKRWKKHSVSPLSTFSLALIFFLLTPSLLWSSFLFFSLLWLFPPLLLYLSSLLEVWLLNFLR